MTAIDYAAKNSTSLNAVKELLGSCFLVLLEACHGVADKFELSDEAVNALADFKRCERERYDLLRKTEMDSADDKRQEGVQFLGNIKYYFSYHCFVCFLESHKSFKYSINCHITGGKPLRSLFRI